MSKSGELTRVINFCSARSYLFPRSVSVRINYRTNINEFSRIAARVTRYRGAWRERDGAVCSICEYLTRDLECRAGRRRERRGRKEEEEGERVSKREKKARSWLNFTAALCVTPLHVYTCSRVCDPRDTCVFTIGCRYLRRHFRCDGVINGNWIEPQSTPSQGYRPAEIYSPDTI